MPTGLPFQNVGSGRETSSLIRKQAQVRQPRFLLENQSALALAPSLEFDQECRVLTATLMALWENKQ